MRILVADDSPAICILLRTTLESHGYEVVTAGNGTQAWEALRDETLRLAILDWEMPGLSGPEVCRKLRAERPMHLKYIILLTIKEGLEYLTEALEAGASDYMVKPCHKAALLARLRVGQRMVQLQMALVQQQKLESIGQLAAGVAHEINTPIQYVGDNLRFLRDAFSTLGRTIRGAPAPTVAGGTWPAGAGGPSAADVAYLLEEVPQAIEQSLEGIDRVTQIVRAMKEFAYPDNDQFLSVDLNAAVRSTVTVARNEWKYVADLETDLDEHLPQVSCMPGQINQVILNLIVNAADAIREAAGAQGLARGKGKIGIGTRSADGWIELSVRDNGPGIPPEVRKRVFDPFFTTKASGKGTGQGLAIAHNVVVSRHGGTIDVESSPGQGACFTIRLPVNQPPAAEAAAGIAPSQGVANE